MRSYTERPCRTLGDREPVGYVLAILGGAIPIAIAAFVGALSMTPPDFSLARWLVIGIAAAIGALSFLWAMTAKEPMNFRLGLGIVGVLFAILALPLTIWWVEAKETAVNPASENISALSDDELRGRASSLSREIRQFEAKYLQELADTVPMSDPPSLTKEQINELWLERSNALIRITARANIEFRRLFLQQLISIIKAMRDRIPNEDPPIPPEAIPALKGELAGSHSASATADYLEILASKLP
jgi:hypothetical protein